MFVLASVLVFLLAFVAGCSRIEGVIHDSFAQGTAASDRPKTGSGGQSPLESNTDDELPADTRSTAESNDAESSGPQPGTAESAELPSAEAIEGCDNSTCSVSDAVTYEHLYQGSVTVVLFADFSKEEYGVCKVAVLSSDGGTAQILPLDFATAYSMAGSDLTNIFYFLDPATDATTNIFFRMPGMDGWSASGLRPVSTGNFELFDLDYVAADFSDIFNSRPMTSLSWGELDENGNYELEIEGTFAQWDGQKYSAP
ncbi:MAG: hypothetical protein L0H42_09255 [Yaniella sp.]|uniref:hypothetical protein n=1 Tax=Yaniella sp. TaxID=2773929 RepID=UPI0026488D46|nr:hypothetical protein [Yaniella sp.]MDN5818496.1 hypothetical protein [Yaniella sp.]